MSSPSFVAKLQPDPILQKCVLVSGVLAMLLGSVIIFAMKISILWRGLVGMVWCADCLFELWRLRLGAAWVQELSLDSDGGVVVLGKTGRATPARLETGSVVFPAIAWIRLRSDSGRYFAGLFTRQNTGAARWHRLQLLWQQSRSVFGHPARP